MRVLVVLCLHVVQPGLVRTPETPESVVNITQKKGEHKAPLLSLGPSGAPDTQRIAPAEAVTLTCLVTDVARVKIPVH